MSRQALRTFTQSAPRRAHPLLTRSLHFTPVFHASKPAHEPASSQGHVVDKSKDSIHRDSDVQSAAARGGQHEKQDAKSSALGSDQPFDAARMGNKGGESKPAQGEGPWKDQVGGQDIPGKGKGAEMGGEQVAAGATITETIKSTISSGFDGLKTMRKVSLAFLLRLHLAISASKHTNARNARRQGSC